VEEVRSEAYGVGIRFYRQGAMNAICPVHERVDVTATTPATIMALKAGGLQKHRSGRTGLLKADDAAARQAGVTCGDAWCTDE
jgi:hypothetical protein